MHKLSELVKLKLDLIDQISNVTLDDAIKEKSIIIEVIKNSNVERSELLTLTTNYDALYHENQRIITTLKDLISKLEHEIDELILTFNADEEYKKMFGPAYTRLAETRTIPTPPHIDFLIQNKINYYCDWRYPGLQLNARLKKWIDSMVISEPLYLIYADDKNLEEQIKDYPEIYRRRLRLYNIEDITQGEYFNYATSSWNKGQAGSLPIDLVAGKDVSKDQTISKTLLPQNNFNFILCWETFNFFSLDRIKSHLEEIFHLLRPGGTVMFSYNNCSLINSAKLAEMSMMSYCSDTFIQKLSDELGYTVTNFKDIPLGDNVYSHISWAELRKPGNLQTARAHPILGKIIDK
jgi:hypothetical protein